MQASLPPIVSGKDEGSRIGEAVSARSASSTESAVESKRLAPAVFRETASRDQSGGRLPAASNVISRPGEAGANSVQRFSARQASEISISSKERVLRIRMTRASLIWRV